MSTSETKSDATIQREVLQELHWDPRVTETEVGVQVREGVVTLAGTIQSYGKKVAAGEAAHRVSGVLDVANDLVVQGSSTKGPTDTEIAVAIRDALLWNTFLDETKIHSTVSDGWVVLEGTVSEWYQQRDVRTAIEHLEGVRGVTNKLEVESDTVDPDELRASIELALARQAHDETQPIHVEVEGGVVTLSGVVRSRAEREALERAAGYAPGVLRVQDDLVVSKDRPITPSKKAPMTKKPLEKLQTELSQWRTRLDELRVQANLGKREARDELNELGERLEPTFRKAKKVVDDAVTSGAAEARTIGKSLLAGWEEVRRAHRELSDESKREQAQGGKKR